MSTNVNNLKIKDIISLPDISIVSIKSVKIATHLDRFLVYLSVDFLTNNSKIDEFPFLVFELSNIEDVSIIDDLFPKSFMTLINQSFSHDSLGKINIIQTFLNDIEKLIMAVHNNLDAIKSIIEKDKQENPRTKQS
jgi:hypothetical protein